MYFRIRTAPIPYLYKPRSPVARALLRIRLGEPQILYLMLRLTILVSSILHFAFCAADTSTDPGQQYSTSEDL